MTQASLQGNLKYSVEYKAPAEKVYDFWTRKPSHIAKLLPENIHNIELLEGTSEEEGGLIKWTYTEDGKNSGSNTCLVEQLDSEKKILSYKVTEGDLKAMYKSFSFVAQITPKDDGGSLANWSLVYEKQNENVLDPIEMRNLAVKVNEAIDEYLANQE